MKRANVFYSEPFLFKMFETAFIHEAQEKIQIYDYKDLVSFEHSQKADIFVILSKNPGDYLKTIKHINNIYPNAKIVISSNVNHKDEVIKAIQHGATDYFFLPLNRQDIINIIGSVS